MYFFSCQKVRTDHRDRVKIVKIICNDLASWFKDSDLGQSVLVANTL